MPCHVYLNPIHSLYFPLFIGDIKFGKKANNTGIESVQGDVILYAPKHAQFGNMGNNDIQVMGTLIVYSGDFTYPLNFERSMADIL